jgi:hypothetical protein
MGAFYNSICIPGRQVEGVRAALDRWLGGRGYSLTNEPILFDLDAESERSAFLVWSDRWTLVFFSHWEEERRLIRELQPGQSPLLYLWVYDSDVWGWDLFGEHGFLGSYSSSPREHTSFGEADEREPRPPGDAATLCQALGLDPVLAPEIQRLEKRQATFKEEIGRALCALLDAEPALSSYDALESGSAENLGEDWQWQQILYFHYPAARAAIDVDLDLHAYEPGSGLMPVRRPPEISPEVHAEMERLRQRARLTMFWLRPLSKMADLWRRTRELLDQVAHRLRGAPPEAEPAPGESPVAVMRTETASRQWLTNTRHGVRLLLPAGVDPLPVSGKPAAVFAFQVGSTLVSCTARRRRALREVLRKPSRAAILRDEKFQVQRLPARHLLFEESARSQAEPAHVALYVVQTGWALYVFLYRMKTLDPEVESLIRTAVGSFAVYDPKMRTVSQ